MLDQSISELEYDSFDCSLGIEVPGLGLIDFEVFGGAALGFGCGLKGTGRGFEVSENDLEHVVEFEND